MIDASSFEKLQRELQKAIKSSSLSVSREMEKNFDVFFTRALSKIERLNKEIEKSSHMGALAQTAKNIQDLTSAAAPGGGRRASWATEETDKLVELTNKYSALAEAQAKRKAGYSQAEVDRIMGQEQEVRIIAEAMEQSRQLVELNQADLVIEQNKLAVEETRLQVLMDRKRLGEAGLDDEIDYARLGTIAARQNMAGAQANIGRARDLGAAQAEAGVGVASQIAGDERARKQQAVADTLSAIGLSKIAHLSSVMNKMRKTILTIFGPISMAMMVIAGVFIAIAMLINKLFGNIKDSAKGLMESGFGVSQAWDAVRGGIVYTANALRGEQGLEMSMVKASQSAGALGNAMGTIHLDPRAVNVVGYLSETLGLAVGEAANLVETMDTFGMNTDEINKTISFAHKAADKSGVLVGKLFANIANSTEIFARWGKKGADAFIIAATRLTAMRLDMSAINDFADGMVSDFESFLNKQAKLQTLFPGLDLTQTMLASQFGSVDNVADELSAALNRAGLTNLADLPRSFQMALKNELGLSYKEIGQLMNLSEDQIAQMAPEDIRLQQEANKTSENMLKSLAQEGAIVTAINRIFGVVEYIANKISLGGYGRDANQEAAIASAVVSVKSGTKTVDQAAEASVPQVDSGSPGSPRWIWDKLWNNPDFNRRIRVAENKLGIQQSISTAPPEKHHQGGIVGQATNTRRSAIARDDVTAVLQVGEAVLSRSQVTGLTKLIESVKGMGAIGNMANRFLSTFNPSTITKSLFGSGGKGGIFGAISGIVSGGSGGLLGKLGGLLGGGGGGGIISKLGGILGGSGGILGKVSGALSGGGIGGIIKGGLGKLLGGGGILGKASSLLGGGGLGSIFKGGLGNILGSVAGGPLGLLAGPLLSKIPGVGSLMKGVTGGIGKIGGGIGKIGGGIIKGIGGLFGGGDNKKIAEMKRKIAAAKASQLSTSTIAPSPPDIMASGTSGLTSINPFAGLVDTPSVQPTGETTTRTGTSDSNQQIVAKLEELISLMRSGGIVAQVKLDGRKVSQGLVAAHSRG